MNKYLCIAAQHYTGDAAWQEHGQQMEGLSPLGAAIDFVQMWPEEAGIKPRNCSEAENLSILVMRCDTEDLTEFYVKIQTEYRIVSAGEPKHIKGAGNASL